MRATIKLLTVIAVLLTLVVPAAEAAKVQCPTTTGGPCIKLDFKPNHICYLPDVSFAPEDVCGLPVGIVDARYNPPRPVVAPRPIVFVYSVLPVDGPPRGFVAVPGNRTTIAAGATGGVVPIQLRPDSLLLEEWAEVQIHYEGDPPLVAGVLITR